MEPFELRQYKDLSGTEKRRLHDNFVQIVTFKVGDRHFAVPILYLTTKEAIYTKIRRTEGVSFVRVRKSKVLMNDDYIITSQETLDVVLRMIKILLNETEQ